MRKVNLENEVIESFEKEKSTLNQFSAVAQIKGLLGYDDTVDRTIMRKMTPLCTEVYAEKEVGKKLELENLEKTYGNKSISINDIRALALKYRMRFLPSTKFKSSLAPEVLSKIKAFSKEHGIELSEHNLTSKFFILGPQEVFSLDKGVERANVIPPIRRISFADDPAIFFKISEDRYVHLCTWGGDFSVVRAIKGFIMKNHRNFFMTLWFINSLFLFTLLSFIVDNIWYLSIISVVLGALAGVIWMVAKDGFFSNQVWRSEKKNEDRMYVFS
jgi:hypothetical protein